MSLLKNKYLLIGLGIFLTGIILSIPFFITEIQTKRILQVSIFTIMCGLLAYGIYQKKVTGEKVNYLLPIFLIAFGLCLYFILKAF